MIDQTFIVNLLFEKIKKNNIVKDKIKYYFSITPQKPLGYPYILISDIAIENIKTINYQYYNAKLYLSIVDKKINYLSDNGSGLNHIKNNIDWTLQNNQNQLGDSFIKIKNNNCMYCDMDDLITIKTLYNIYIEQP